MLFRKIILMMSVVFLGGIIFSCGKDSQLSPASEEAVYQVAEKDSVRAAKSALTISVPGFSLTAAGQEAVECSWDAVTQAPIPRDWRIRWKKTSDPAYPSWTNDSGNAYPKGTSYVIRGLECGVEYAATIRPRYHGSAGDWTEASGSTSPCDKGGRTDPPVDPPVDPPDNQLVTSQVTISEGTTPVTEGMSATFTITASPAPTTALTVNVGVDESGNTITVTPPSTVIIGAGETTATLTVSTVDDLRDEPSSLVTAKLQYGTGYTVDRPSSASVTVNDNDDSATGDPLVTIVEILKSVEEGTDATFGITVFPRPAPGLVIELKVVQTGDVISGTPSTSVTIDDDSGFTVLTIATADDTVDESNGKITVHLQAGTGYTVDSPSSASVVVEDNDIPLVIPVVTISAVTTPVTEGMPATFTITATPPPISKITVVLRTTETGKIIDGTPPPSVTINTEKSVTFRIATDDDIEDETGSTITVRLQVGTGYTVDSPSSASVVVEDNDIAIPPLDLNDITFAMSLESYDSSVSMRVPIAANMIPEDVGSELFVNYKLSNIPLEVSQHETVSFEVNYTTEAPIVQNLSNVGPFLLAADGIVVDEGTFEYNDVIKIISDNCVADHNTITVSATLTHTSNSGNVTVSNRPIPSRTLTFIEDDVGKRGCNDPEPLPTRVDFGTGTLYYSGQDIIIDGFPIESGRLLTGDEPFENYAGEKFLVFVYFEKEKNGISLVGSQFSATINQPGFNILESQTVHGNIEDSGHMVRGGFNIKPGPGYDIRRIRGGKSYSETRVDFIFTHNEYPNTMITGHTVIKIKDVWPDEDIDKDGVPDGIGITVTRASSNSSTISEGDNVLHEGEIKEFKVVLKTERDLLRSCFKIIGREEKS